jgi:hypothetical protein
MGEVEIGWYVPHSWSGASQVTVVDPLNEEVRLRLKIDIWLSRLPVVPHDGDGRAAQPDGHIEAGEVKTEEGGDGGSGGAGRRDNAVAALWGGGWGHRGSVPGHGGSKGLR